MVTDTPQDLTGVSNRDLVSLYETGMSLWCSTPMGNDMSGERAASVKQCRIELLRRLDPDAMVARVLEAIEAWMIHDMKSWADVKCDVDKIIRGTGA